MAIKFIESIGDPIAGDIGNKVIQRRTVSKTLQFGLFTTNKNAVEAGRIQLQKESFPFALISVPLNRDTFRFQVGDVFLLSYAKYGIVNMVVRILLIEEENIESEKRIFHVIQDVYSASNQITEYNNPTDSRIPAVDYTTTPFSIQDVFEAPYALTNSLSIIPLAARETDIDQGMIVYMSLDESSYLRVDQKSNIQPYGTLTVGYGLTNPIDTAIGILVDFPTSDVSRIDTITWAETLSGENNFGIINDEIISFQTITPVSGTIYRLTNIIRSRYGTNQDIHLVGSGFWFVTKKIGLVDHSELIAGVSRKIKLIPYNQNRVGSLADATPIDINLSGKVKTPYIPTNFDCNGVSFASRYTADCILTWNARKRGEGAGVGTPGIVLAAIDHEGLFDVEVWVSSALVRTETDIDALTWTYDFADNISDNGTLASEIEFKITNHRLESGTTYISDSVSVITKLTT